MASAPQPQLPLFYKDLLPLNSRDHANWKAGTLESAEYLSVTHAIPVTSDEFVDAQRHFPIVFTAGDSPLPIALFGLNSGAALATVVGVLVEVPVMLTIVAMVKRSRGWYEAGARRS